jgi:hypothetical protein
MAKGLEIILGAGKPPGDAGEPKSEASKEDAGPDEGLASAYEEFDSAKTTAAKVEALKAFVHMCMDKYGPAEGAEGE